MLTLEAFRWLYEEAYRRASSGDFQGAIQCYEALLSEMDGSIDFPEVAALHANLMHCYAHAGRLEDAREQATRAVRSVSTLAFDEKAEVYVQLADFLCDHAPPDELSGALAMVDEAVAQGEGPTVLHAMATKMRLLLRLDRLDEAKAVARAALAIDADHVEFRDAKTRFGLGDRPPSKKLPPFVRRVEVKGVPPRPTLGMRAAFSPVMNRLFLFGGDKRAEDVAADDEVRQRNTVVALAPEGAGFRWEGPIGSTVDDPLENSETAVLPRSEHVWVETANPRYLMAHGGTNQDGRGVTFMQQGGLADWLAFDTSSACFIELEPPLLGRSRLPILIGHAAVFDRQSGRVIMLRSAATEDDLAEQGMVGAEALSAIVFETSGEPPQWSHRRLAARGLGPTVRAGYGIAQAGRSLVVFGGAFTSVGEAGAWSTDWPEELAVLDLESFLWQRPHVVGTRPGGRIDHAVIAIDDGQVLVAGGRRGFGDERRELEDLHVLELRSMRWRRVPGELRVPAGATWTAYGEGRDRRVLIIGGDDETIPVFELDLSRL